MNERFEKTRIGLPDEYYNFAFDIIRNEISFSFCNSLLRNSLLFLLFQRSAKNLIRLFLCITFNLITPYSLYVPYTPYFPYVPYKPYTPNTPNTK